MTLLGIIVAVMLIIGLLGREQAIRELFGGIGVTIFLYCGLNHKKSRILNKVKVTDSKAEGGVETIAHVVVATTGIFVVEVKNLNGRISGKEEDDVWMRDLYGSKYQTPNPFKSNRKYIQELAKRADQPESVFHHIVVLIGDSSLKTKDELPDDLVLSSIQMLGRIRKRKDSSVIAPEQLDAIRAAILSSSR